MPYRHDAYSEAKGEVYQKDSWSELEKTKVIQVQVEAGVSGIFCFLLGLSGSLCLMNDRLFLFN